MSHNTITIPIPTSNPCHEQYEDLYDTTAAAAAAEAEIIEANAAAAAHQTKTSTQHPQAQTQTITAPGGTDEQHNAPFPAVDIFSSPSHYTLHVSVPGAKAGDVSAELAASGQAVVVRGVVRRPEGLGELIKGEERVGRFERVVALPGVAGGLGREGGLRSGVEDGVLVVKVPKEGVDDREVGEEGRMG